MPRKALIALWCAFAGLVSAFVVTSFADRTTQRIAAFVCIGLITMISWYIARIERDTTE